MQQKLQKLFFKNSKGDKLCGILSAPDEDRDRPIIVMCTGLNSDKGSNTYLKLENELNKNNIAIFRFDYFGHGESEGRFEDITISEAIDDTMHAIEYVKSLGYKKIGLFGSSFGGIVALIVASRLNEIYVLALKAPVSNYISKLVAQKTDAELSTWKQQGYIYYPSFKYGKRKLNYSFYKDAEKYNGYEAADKIEIPTLIVHGDKDITVPLEQSKKTASIIENCKLEIIKYCDHLFSKPEHFDKWLKLTTDFVVKNS